MLILKRRSGHHYGAVTKNTLLGPSYPLFKKKQYMHFSKGTRSNYRHQIRIVYHVIPFKVPVRTWIPFSVCNDRLSIQVYDLLATIYVCFGYFKVATMKLI